MSDVKNKKDDKIKFFISYNKADAQWAKWIAGTLEENGYITIIQAWDFQPGNNFILEMQHAIEDCDRCIAVLSQNYLESDYCQPEWAAIFNKDPLGDKKALIPVRVSNVKPSGLLSGIICIDLFNINDEGHAIKELLKGVDPQENPRRKTTFPSAQYPEKQQYISSNQFLLDECRIKICKGEDIFNYVNKNVDVLIHYDHWVQIQIVVNELISNVIRHSNASKCFLELTNTSIALIDNGNKFNPLNQLKYTPKNTSKNMGALVIKKFIEEHSELIDVVYKHKDGMNKVAISFKDCRMFNVESICTLKIALNGVNNCTTRDIILPRGTCTNYYFDVWSEERTYGVSISFLVTTIETILHVIPKRSKLVVFDRSSQLDIYKEFYEFFPQVIFRDCPTTDYGTKR